MRNPTVVEVQGAYHGGVGGVSSSARIREGWKLPASVATLVNSCENLTRAVACERGLVWIGSDPIQLLLGLGFTIWVLHSYEYMIPKYMLFSFFFLVFFWL